MSAQKLWTVNEVAAFLNMKKYWVYKYIPALPLPGRLKRFDPQVIQQLKFAQSSLKTKDKATVKDRKSESEDLWS